MRPLFTTVRRIIEQIVERIIQVAGSRVHGSKRRFPWIVKQQILGLGRIRTVVRLPGTRIFLLRGMNADRFTFSLWIWREGWNKAGMLFAGRNEEGGINISDVLSYYQGNGYGTLLVRTCLDVATDMGASHVEGFLSPVDDVPRLATFYGRLGFDVTLTATGESGHIMKKLC